MPTAINDTHDPSVKSWVESANDPATDFPLQNLPLGQAVACLNTRPGYEDDEDAASLFLSTLVTPIGDEVLDVGLAIELGLLDVEGVEQDELREWADDHGTPESLTAYGFDVPDILGALRRALHRLLAAGRSDARELAAMPGLLRPAREVELLSPVSTIGNYTDFYASVHHATNVGSMFRPDNALLPNYKHIPIGYHGRASSIVSSGTEVRRPMGQLAPAHDGGSPSFGPCAMLDYELELGWVVGRGNELGGPIPITRAEEHILGVCLVNDWSARDIQKWEYQPLGPFLAKSFATTISPYIVTMEALAPFRCPAFERPSADPHPLPYLDAVGNREHGGIDITVEAWLDSAQMRTRGLSPVRLSRGSFKHMYWTIAQMLTHHASNGCNLQPGDLMASGTVSGPTRASRGCLLELTWDGDPWGTHPASGGQPRVVPGSKRTPIELPTGEQRVFLADGDEVILRAYCEREGYRRIGFGECRGVVTPARPALKS